MMSTLLSSARWHLLAAWLVLIPLGRAQELYVGANYHPHDLKREDWRRDIALMKAADFRVVRMGHLAWDSYEPTDGKFEFAWFDEVMDQMNAAGIKVILDLAVRPAPLWLHRKYPSISITNSSGNLLYSNTRYMVDVGDPNYQQYALRYAETLVKHYAKHPALLAFGIDNEPGDGPISYSETVRARFIVWLKNKYANLASLNEAWSGQRWSRKIGDFEEVGLPASGSITGAPERVLDFRLFVSDEVNHFLLKVMDRVKENAPGALATTNMWYYSSKKYFDYSEIAYTGRMTRAGCGFYPGNSLIQNGGLEHALFGIARIQFENTTPFWCTEFPTFTSVPGAMRKAAYASLMLGNQMACAWTWQTMHGGEEQYHEGMMDWDGVTNRKYDEYKQIAAEFKKIGPYGFPYKLKAEVALAFSFPSQIVSAAYPEEHDNQIQTAFNVFLHRNVDTRVVELSRSQLPYKLLIIPGVTSLDAASALHVREFVQKGGTVVMTGYSGVVDEHDRVFSTPHPGRLNDVFGIRVAGFEETSALNELSTIGLRGNSLRIAYAGREAMTEVPRIDVIQSQGAEIHGRVLGLDRDYPIITSNKFGAGTAIYVGIPARQEILALIVDDIIEKLAIKTGPAVPPGVMARSLDEKHWLYLNLEGKAKRVELKGHSKSILRDLDYRDGFTLGAFEPEFVEKE